jgi:hypothetical protein
MYLNEDKMRYYNSKNVEREYVVVKHQLRGIDTEVLGVRYREGYGVVAKNSKEYYNLKKIKLCIVAEYPITALGSLKCVTAPAQIKTIWGANVFNAYKKALAEQAKKEEETQEVKDYIEPLEKIQCEKETAAGTQCKNDAIEHSCFCRVHIHFDKRIAAKLIEAGDIDKTLRKKLIEQWVTELE